MEDGKVRCSCAKERSVSVIRKAAGITVRAMYIAETLCRSNSDKQRSILESEILSFDYFIDYFDAVENGTIHIVGAVSHCSLARSRQERRQYKILRKYIGTIELHCSTLSGLILDCPKHLG